MRLLLSLINPGTTLVHYQSRLGNLVLPAYCLAILAMIRSGSVDTVDRVVLVYALLTKYGHRQARVL